MTQHLLVRRRDAAQATLDAWKDRPWRLGEFDCGRLVASHLRRLGYRVRLPRKHSYRTELGAVRALLRMGHASLSEALDAIGLQQIAPAAAIVGDVVELPSCGRVGALTVALGNGRVLGWHEDMAGAAVLQPLGYVAAWRADPR